MCSYIMEDWNMRLHKEQLNEVHELCFIKGIMHVKIGDNWEVVELWDDKTNCFRYVFKEDL